MELTLGPLPGQEICDFCSSPDVKWSIACAPINLGVYGSDDDWAGCDVCVDLIANKKWEELSKRSIDAFHKNNPTVPRRISEECISALHREFRLKHGEITPFVKNVA